jgi:hypothetical protein
MSNPMKAGEAQIGQQVITLRTFAAWPDVAVGTMATIKEILAQIPGAEADALAIHPHIWGARWEHRSLVCESGDVELVG